MVYYLHGDHLGSTSLTTDSSGAVVSEVRYLPYGQERWTNEVASPTDFGFTSQRAEKGFGLYDYNARYYSPYLGRFISPDSIVPEPWHPGAFNRYTYIDNNPVRNIDPTGHQCVGATCPPLPPPQIPWQSLAQMAGPLAVAAPEAPVAVATTVTAIAVGTGAYLGSAWAMEDMGPANPANPWTSGWTETFDLEEGELMVPTIPLGGTSTLGSNVETFPLEDVNLGSSTDFPLGVEPELTSNVWEASTPPFVKDAGTLVSWGKVLERLYKTTGYIPGAEDVDALVNKAREYGVDIRLDDPHPGTPWNVRHINVGKKGQVHVPVPEDYELPE